MKPYELFDLIRLNNPNELELKHTLRFRRRSRSNPCSFDDLIQALRSNESIRTVRCQGNVSLGITQEEWFLFVQTLGTIPALRQLSFLGQDVPNVPPVQAVADAVGSARLLRTFQIGEGVILFGSKAGFEALCHNIGSCCSDLEQMAGESFVRRGKSARIATPTIASILISSRCVSFGRPNLDGCSQYVTPQRCENFWCVRLLCST
jgi:hypothetical protein